MKDQGKKAIYQVLLDQPAEMYDGHTEFQKMTPNQRLRWLGQAAYFVHMNKGKINNSARDHVE